MSYYATFKPTEEAMKKYEPAKIQTFSSKDVSMMKLSLMVDVLKDPGDVKVESFAFNTKLLLKYIESEIERSEHRHAYNLWKEDGEVWYCGWTYAKTHPELEMSEVYDFVLKKLVLLHYCAKSGDYLDEGDQFHNKLNEIEEILEYFEDQCMEHARFEIMDELKEFRVGEEYDEQSADCSKEEKVEDDK